MKCFYLTFYVRKRIPQSLRGQSVERLSQGAPKLMDLFGEDIALLAHKLTAVSGGSAMSLSHRWQPQEETVMEPV
jgi:hypothetical protein